MEGIREADDLERRRADGANLSPGLDLGTCGWRGEGDSLGPSPGLGSGLGPSACDATKCKNGETNDGEEEEGLKTPKDGCDSENDVDPRQRVDPDPETPLESQLDPRGRGG